MEGHKYRTHTRQVATVHNGVKFFFEGAFLLFFCVYFLSSYLYLQHSFRFIPHKTINVVEIYFENEGTLVQL